MISVIIPSYNSENTIKLCLDSLLSQSTTEEFEIILVDSSVDSTPKIVKSNYGNVQFIHLEEKTDPGTARNIGIKNADGSILAFIDSDCIADPDWIEKIHLAHSSQYKVIGGVVKNANRDDDLVGLAGYIAEFRESIPGQTRKEVSHIPTCNLSFKREIFNCYGFFQGEYFPTEDRVYNYYLRKNGVKILMDPQIQVSHNHRSRLKDFLYHQKKIGFMSVKMLKSIPLEGHFIVRNRIFAFVFLPVLPIVKFWRTLFIFLRYQPRIIYKNIRVLIYYLIGIIFWIVGFAQGIYANEPIINNVSKD